MMFNLITTIDDDSQTTTHPTFDSALAEALEFLHLGDPDRGLFTQAEADALRRGKTLTLTQTPDTHHVESVTLRIEETP
jgi:hypothetical protein